MFSLMSSYANQNLRGGRMGAPTFETLVLSFNSVLYDNAWTHITDPPLRRRNFGNSISNALQHMRVRNLSLKKSFHPDAVIISWNDLRHELRQTEKLSASKAILL